MSKEQRYINPKATLLEGLKQMDNLDRKLLLVTDDKKFIGLLSVGDIQRAIIQNKPLDAPVISILRKQIKVAKPSDSFEDIKQMMIEYRMELCPVINEKQEIMQIYFWEDIFVDRKPKPKVLFKLPVVVMAGGLGTRLKPLTNVIPKPLIPFNDKTILEEILDRFNIHGCNEFYISLNYKAELVEFYLKNQNLPYELSFFKEEKPMGTIGSLSLLKEKINQTCFVTNCDIVIEQDYSEILDYHKGNNNEITIVAALKHYNIPYGTIESGVNGQLTQLKEKPELTFKINSGMYILEPHTLVEIPENQFFHITQLIEKLQNQGRKIGVFPVSEKSWKDVGSWLEYKEMFIK